MKTLILILFLCVSFESNSQTPFERGFKDGFKVGYCYSNQPNVFCSPPLPPLTPLPQLNEDSSYYSDGYNRGFIVGRTERDKKDSNYRKREVNSKYPEFNKYVPQFSVDAYALAGMARQQKYDIRTRWIQDRINGLAEIITRLFSQETCPGMAVNATRKIYMDKIAAYTSTYSFASTDFADDYQFQIVKNKFQEIENIIFKNYNYTVQTCEEDKYNNISANIPDEKRFLAKHKGSYCANATIWKYVNNNWEKRITKSGFVDILSDAIILLDDYKCGEDVVIDIEEDINYFGYSYFDVQKQEFQYWGGNLIIHADFSNILVYTDDRKTCTIYTINPDSKW